MELLKWGTELQEPFDRWLTPILPAPAPQTFRVSPVNLPHSSHNNVLEDEDLDVKADSPDMVLSRVITSYTRATKNIINSNNIKI
jgi:hypothetical protein